MKLTDLPPSFFEKEKTLVTFSNSILKAFGLPTFHITLKEADTILEGKRKIAVFLFDGMGEYIQKVHSKQSQFIYSHKLTTIYSTNPATTVAATNAVRSGRYPIETGWMGWTMYFPEIDCPINCFPQVDSRTEKKPSNWAENTMRKNFAYESIAKLLRNAGFKAKEEFFYPVRDALNDNPSQLGNGPKSLKEMRARASRFFRDGGEFLYSYCTNPDYLIHHYGVNSKKVARCIKNINKMVQRFVKENPDVTLFVLADHGLLDVNYVDLKNYPDIKECIDNRLGFVMEGRTPSFFVKPGMEESFVERWTKIFGERSSLFKTKDAIEQGYFGEGEAIAGLGRYLGNYCAVFLDNTVICDSQVMHRGKHAAHHAGGCDQERLVCLSCFPGSDKK